MACRKVGCIKSVSKTRYENLSYTYVVYTVPEFHTKEHISKENAHLCPVETLEFPKYHSSKEHRPGNKPNIGSSKIAE